MTKWIYFATLFSVVLLLGASTQAAAQSKDQQADSQQQTSQQQDQKKQQKQQNTEQSGDKQASTDNSKASAKSQKKQVPPELFIKTQQSTQVLASSIIGMSIQNGTGKKAAAIGTVSDLIMNKQHQLVGIVVGIGGFLGIGEKQVGITWDAVENIDMKKGIAVVTVDKKQLQNAPSFTNKQEQHEKQMQKRAKKQMQKQQKKMSESQKKMQQQQQKKKAPSQGGNAAASGG